MHLACDMRKWPNPSRHEEQVVSIVPALWFICESACKNRVVIAESGPGLNKTLDRKLSLISPAVSLLYAVVSKM